MRNGGGSAQSEHAGRVVIACDNAGLIHSQQLVVAGGEVVCYRHGSTREQSAVDVTQINRIGHRQRCAVFGVHQCAAFKAGDRRCIVNGRKCNCPAQLIALRQTIVDRHSQCSGINGGVIAKVYVRYRTNRSLIIRHTGGAGQREHSRTVAAGDPRLVCKQKPVFRGHKVCRDGDGGGCYGGVVDIPDKQRCGDRDSGTIFDKR